MIRRRPEVCPIKRLARFLFDPQPYRFFEAETGYKGWTPEEEEHLENCDRCAEYRRRVKDALKTTRRRFWMITPEQIVEGMLNEDAPCPECGAMAYHGLNTVECPTKGCKNYSTKQTASVGPIEPELLSWCEIREPDGWMHQIEVQYGDIKVLVRDDTDEVMVMSDEEGITPKQAADLWRQYKMGTSTFGMGLPGNLRKRNAMFDWNLYKNMVFDGSGVDLSHL